MIAIICVGRVPKILDAAVKGSIAEKGLSMTRAVIATATLALSLAANVASAGSLSPSAPVMEPAGSGDFVLARFGGGGHGASMHGGDHFHHSHHYHRRHHTYHHWRHWHRHHPSGQQATL
jgi:hypothetical protein